MLSHQSPIAVSEVEAFRTFARIGLLSFGGPAAQIAVMHRILVDEKKWLSEERFLHALNFCMLLPGPEAMQLATYSGWLLHGVRGGIVAGLLFIMPGLAMMLALSAVYVAFGDVPVLEGIFYGLKAAVIAIVLQALLKVAKRALGTAAMHVIAVLAFIAIFFVQVPFPLIVAGAALAGFILMRIFPSALPLRNAASERKDDKPRASTMRETRTALLVWGMLWLIPLAILVFTVGGFPGQAALFFSQTAIVTFGGAYAVLAYVAQQVVDAFGWLSPDDMLTGLGLAETTLGPLVLVLVFVGFAGAANLAGGSLLAGLGGGLIAAFFTFVPCFLWIFAGAPHMERLRHLRWLSAALAAVTAAVVGVIANLAVWFAIAVLFGDPAYAEAGPLRYPQIDHAGLDMIAAAIAAVSAVALMRFKLNMGLVLAGAAIAGLAAANL